MSDKLVMRLMVMSDDDVDVDDMELADASRVRDVVRTHDQVCVYVHPEADNDPSENGISLSFMKDQNQGDEDVGFFNGSVGLGWVGDEDPNKVWMEPLIKAAEKSLDALINAVAA